MGLAQARQSLPENQMAWITLTDGDVLNEFTPAERAVLNTLQGGSTQLSDILGKTVASARGSILAGGNDIDADGTIPEQVVPEVIAIARWRWLTSFSALKNLQTPARESASKMGLELLERIANGKPKVEAPANPQPQSESLITLPSVGCRPHKFTRRTEDGIL